MTVPLCIRQGSKRNDDSVSVEELDWSAESQLNTSGVTLNADLEPKVHHQTPMTCTYGYSNFIHFKTVATEVEIIFKTPKSLVFEITCFAKFKFRLNSVE